MEFIFFFLIRTFRDAELRECLRNTVLLIPRCNPATHCSFLQYIYSFPDCTCAIVLLSPCPAEDLIPNVHLLISASNF